MGKHSGGEKIPQNTPSGGGKHRKRADTNLACELGLHADALLNRVRFTEDGPNAPLYDLYRCDNCGRTEAHKVQ